MSKNTVIGILFTIILGSIMHFVYEWTNENTIVGLFAPINESTWEHLKLLAFPYLAYMLWEYWRYDTPDNFITAKTIGLIIGLIFIPTIFYTYTSIIGTHYLWADIALFVLSVLLAFGVSSLVMTGTDIQANSLSAMAFIVIVGLFFIFTFYPPRIELFLDPITHTYGINENVGIHMH